MGVHRNIIEQAYKDHGVVGQGGLPDADQMRTGMRHLNQFVASLYSPFIENSLTKVLFTKEDSTTDMLWHYIRLYVPGTEDVTLKMPETVAGYSLISVVANNPAATYSVTLETEFFPFDTGASYTISSGDAPAVFLFREDRGQWMLLGPRTVEQDTVLPDEYDQFMISALANLLAPEYAKHRRSQHVDTERSGHRRFLSQMRPPQELLQSTLQEDFSYYGGSYDYRAGGVGSPGFVRGLKPL